MKQDGMMPVSAGFFLCAALSGCVMPGVQSASEKNLNEQAAWATSVGVARRPVAVAAVQGEGGAVRLTAGDLSSTAPPAPAAPPAQRPPVAAIAQVAPPPAAQAAPVAPLPEAVTDAERRVVLNTILAWRKAWVEGDVATYIAAYEPVFKDELPSRAAWEKQRRARVAGGNIMVRIENMAVRVMPEEATAEFTQRYVSRTYEDVGLKTLKLRKIGGKWLIVEESWRKT